MRILFVGDIVGSSGRKMLQETLPKLKKRWQPTVTIVNGENAAGGRGITKKIAASFFESDVNVITLGNHTWDNKEVFDFIDDEEKLIRPANFPEDTPGRGYTFIQSNNREVAVINLQGRTFLPPLECPFRTADRILEEVRKRTKLIFVDFHAEATSEKQAMGWYLDGKVSAVVGTHTHVQTADERILPGGTAYISDVGMVGHYDGILGMKKEPIMKKFLSQLPVRFEVEDGRRMLNAVLVDLDEKNGHAQHIQRIRIDEDQGFMME